ncbi:DUF3219 family protein [Lysinibacillus xylanilyticus]|uniref:DUF3219 family protein n=1 Tax=Lysinibacillus xylanilyticus TaxID=582475 RepID=UPI0037F1AD88
MLIILNGVKIDADIEKVNEEQKEFEVEFEVVGENNYNLYSALLANGKIEVDLPDFDLKYEGKVNNLTKSYRDTLNENTIVNISFKISEFTDEAPEWNAFTGLVATAVANWSRTRALAEILKKHNLMTTDEYETLISDIQKSDFEEMRKFITEGK